MTEPLPAIIEAAWERRAEIGAGDAAVAEAVAEALAMLDAGAARVAEPDGTGGWRVNQWLKKAVLLSFRLTDNALIEGGSAGHPAYDKVPSKFAGWDEARFRAAGIRVVPGAIARAGAYIAPGCVLMPSFVNIGALRRRRYHDRHLGLGRIVRAGGQGLSHISAGRRDRRGTRTDAGQPHHHRRQLLHRRALRNRRGRDRGRRQRGGDGGVHHPVDQDRPPPYRRGRSVAIFPPFSVVVPRNPARWQDGGPSLACAVIIKTVDAGTRAKTGINDLLRD